jgi:hypothetical protein
VEEAGTDLPISLPLSPELPNEDEEEEKEA